jgi:hypothetical protein
VTVESNSERGHLVINSKVILFYLLMLVGHVAHFLEEVWGRFWLMDAVFGLGWFLVVNWVLFCIPVVILYKPGDQEDSRKIHTTAPFCP